MAKLAKSHVLLLCQFFSIAVGQSWVAVEDTSVGSTKAWRDVAMSGDGTKRAAIVYGGNIWTSSDSGATWVEDTSVGSTKNWVQIAISGDGSKMVAIVFYGNIWTSSDGATWSEDTSVGSAQSWGGVAISSDGAKLVAVSSGVGTAFGSGGSIWTSSDGGVTWSEDTSVGQGLWWRGVAMSGDGTKMIATVSGEFSGARMWSSSDGGATWTQDMSSPVEPWRGVAMSADGMYAVAYEHWNLWVYQSFNWTHKKEQTGANQAWQGFHQPWQGSPAISADGSKVAAVTRSQASSGQFNEGQVWVGQGLGLSEWENPGGSGNWGSVAMSADGTQMLCAVNGGNLWSISISTTTTTSVGQSDDPVPGVSPGVSAVVIVIVVLSIILVCCALAIIAFLLYRRSKAGTAP